MSLQHSIKHLSAIALIGLVWGCNTSKQAIVSKSSSGEVYDDLYASTSDVRPATLGGRIYNEQGYDESTYQAPVYRNNGNSSNNSAQGTNEYYSQNWLNSRTAYQTQDDYSAGYNNGYANGYNNGLGYNYGLNNWYSNPAISFGLGFSRWSPFGFSSMGMGYYDPFYSNFYDPYWGWSSSRWMYGNSFGYGYSPYGFGGYYDPFGYRYSSLAYGGYYGGYYNNYYNSYVGSVVGADTPAKYRSRPTYSSSAYNSDFNNNRGSAYNRGSRTNADYSSTNSDYYSRPRRDGGSYTTGTTANSSRSSNSSYSNGRNSSWDWSSNNNNNNNSNNRSNNSTWNNSTTNSSSSYSSGSSGGGGGGGRSRGPR